MTTNTTRKKRPVVATESLPGATEYNQALAEYTGLNDTLRDLEALKKRVSGRLEFYLRAWMAELPDVATAESGFYTDLGQRGAYRVELQQRAGSKEIKAELLLQAGVEWKTVEAATVQGPPSKEFVHVQRLHRLLGHVVQIGEADDA